MKNLLLLISAGLFSAGALCAQQADENVIIPINLDSLKVVATPEKYAEVQARFEALDENFTYDDAVMLYYGFAFQPGYKGSADAIYSPVSDLLEEGEYEKAWEAGVGYLKENPVSLTTYENMLLAAMKLEKSKEEAGPYIIRMFGILDIIRSSGDGKSEDTAYKVLAVADEYTFMRRGLGVYNTSRQGFTGKCDAFTLSDGETMYFDVTLPYQHGAKMLMDKSQ